MTVSPTYPGVYVQEIPSGVRTIVGVSTSIGMFMGTSKKGPIGEPVRCTSYMDFSRNFSEDPTGGQLAQYVKLFFLNGGTDCYVMRIAHGATQSSVVLNNEAGAAVLQLIAKDAGLAGESIRASVSYSGPQPESTFNIDLFQWDLDSSGRRVRTRQESWKKLSMDLNSPNYAQDFLTQNSKLVNAVDVGPAGGDGFSLSGRAVSDAPGFQTAWQPLFGTLATSNRFQITIGNNGPVMVDLSTVAVGASDVATAPLVATAIQNAFAAAGVPGIVVTVSFPLSAASGTRRMKIAPDGVSTHGDVYITTGSTVGTQRDLAVPLMLGSGQGGLEVSGNADRRPAPNGIVFRATEANLDALADLLQIDLGVAPGNLTLEVFTPQPGGGYLAAPGPPITPQTTSPSVHTVAAAGSLVFQDAAATSLNGNSDGVREKLSILARIINAVVPAAPQVWKWKAEVWGSRLAILPADDLDDNFISTAFTLGTNPALPAGAFTNNVHYYSVGASGASIGEQTSAGAPASDGTAPLAADYDAVYPVLDREVDLFNLMVLPPDAAVPITSIYPNASVFCQQRRAFLLMDPPTSWTSAQQAATGVAALHIGLVKDFSAVFFPRITISQSGLNVNIGPSGAIAGLCARIDGSRGVWKTPAGTEADLRGVVGLEYKLSDSENGITNPRAVNTIRIFPDGIVNWGGRTADGDDSFASEYKYICIRRLALYLEESLYRGLKWVVFEPNDEPLWSQIRLNVGSFMHDLFRQGAFQGSTPSEAYFVKCDHETTTASDQNRGIVNIMVGFAPLKPAEFVILYLQQMAGQIQV